MKGDYKLIPEPIPAISKATVYEDIIEDFMGQKNCPSARVEIAKKKPATVHQGLLKAKRLNPKLSPVSVVRRGDAIYLKK